MRKWNKASERGIEEVVGRPCSVSWREMSGEQSSATTGAM